MIIHFPKAKNEGQPSHLTPTLIYYPANKRIIISPTSLIDDPNKREYSLDKTTLSTLFQEDALLKEIAGDEVKKNYIEEEITTADKQHQKKLNEDLIKAELSNYFIEKDGRLKFIPKKMGDKLLEQNTYITFADTNEIFYYRDGIYLLAEPKIKEEVKHRLHDLFTSHHANETIYYMRAATYKERQEMDAPKHLLLVQNGLLDTQLMRLEKETPNYFFTSKLPISFDPNAQCSEIEKFLSEVMSPEDAENIFELFGYCLYRDYPLHKAFMFLGDGSNGKSVTISLFKAFLGKENISSVALQEVDQRFAKIKLYGKLANLYADLSSRSLRTTGSFKMLTGNDPLEAEQKFKDSFQFENYAKMIFSCNQLPETSDDTEAFWRRWCLINFPNIFDEKRRDIKKIEKITTPKELSGLLNRAIIALGELLERGAFKHSKTTEQIRADYMRKSSPIQAFAMDDLLEDPESMESKEEVYVEFVKYCVENNLPRVVSEVFFKKLKSMLIVTEERHRVDGELKRFLKGVKIVKNKKKEEEHSSSNPPELKNENKSILYKNEKFESSVLSDLEEE